ncbi:hypothetical protein EV578_115123 [Streptomyces sp. BK205]|nr:hypothetical protein EV578_115123 [Streptomyces sp. BK205]
MKRDVVVRPGQTPTYSRQLIPYTTTRDTIRTRMYSRVRTSTTSVPRMHVDSLALSDRDNHLLHAEYEEGYGSRPHASCAVRPAHGERIPGMTLEMMSTAKSDLFIDLTTAPGEA